jgi:hypothetical protein
MHFENSQLHSPFIFSISDYSLLPSNCTIIIASFSTPVKCTHNLVKCTQSSTSFCKEKKALVYILAQIIREFVIENLQANSEDDDEEEEEEEEGISEKKLSQQGQGEKQLPILSLDIPGD